MNGGSETVGQVKYDARIDTSQLPGDSKRADSIVSGAASKTQKSVNQSTSKMSADFRDVAGSVAGVAGAFLSIQGLKNFIGDSIDEANRMQGSMIGLTTVSNAYGESALKARTAARELAADGLMPVNDAATSLKNLLATGFSLDEAITLIERFKNTAAFGRQSALEFGESIRGATEGIKNGNSILVDNAGVTKNLSVILQEAGKSQQDVMNITSDASVRQALYNGLIRETNAQMGDAARLAATAAGADARLGVETQSLMVQAGNLANTLRAPLVQSLTAFIAGNQQAILSTGAGVVAMAGLAGGAYGAYKAVGALRVGLTLLARHPAIAVLSLVFGLFAGSVVGKMIDQTEAAGDSMYDLGDATGGATDQVDGLSEAAQKLQDQLAKIDDQIAKTNRDFREQLAEMVREHQSTIKDITKQLKDEESDYQKAYSDRLATFQEEQDEEAQSHQEKVSKLQSQIDFLRRYTNASNAQQLSDLQFALAQENAEYDEQLAKRQTKYDEDAAYEKQKHDERTLDLQTRLDSENALLTKHAADVAAIRGVQLLDEIQKLKRSRDEQLKSLDQQKRDALKNASETASGVGAAYGGLGSTVETSMKGAGKAAGEEMGKAFKKALRSALDEMWKDLADLANNNDFAKWLRKQGYDTMHNKNGFAQFFQQQGKNFGNFLTGRRAAGGPVSSGGLYAVGDNPDGTWNKTTELFAPKQSGTIIPADEVQAMVSGRGSGSAMNITLNVNMSGIMSSSAADERAIAKRLIERLNEEFRAKGLPEIGAAA